MPHVKSTLIALAVTLSISCPARAAERESHVGLTLQQIVDGAIRPHLAYLFERIATEGSDLRLDGVPVFDGRDKFLPGKIAKGVSYLLTDGSLDGEALERALADHRRIAAMTLEQTNESWGMYYYLSALRKLRDAGLLERAVDPATLERLRERLDWRAFVREDDLTLVALPTNYYGVAFTIARLRHLLGWESAEASERLLARTIEHYRTHSGEYGFSDETEGEGRFDRYSVLLIGEICQHLVDYGMETTPELREWLRSAVEVVLVGLGPEGAGFQFGRSIGPYADTAYLEVLTAAAALDVLSSHEKEMAYAFHVRAAARFVDFWYDPQMRSVNLWDHGRRTDTYRGKHRILGENLSLVHQHLYTAAIWRRLGFAQRPPDDAAFMSWLRALPRQTLTWFARGEHDRALVTYRDGLRVVQLPIVNGGPSQHMHNPYFAIPFSDELVQGSANATFPQLLPRFTLADGSQLTAAAYARGIEAHEDGDAFIVEFEQTELDRLGERSPIPDDRLSVRTTYLLEPGRFTRTDVYTPREALTDVRIEMEFSSFSENGRLSDDGRRVDFASGAARTFEVEGFTSLTLEAIADDPVRRAPTGPMRTRIQCVETLAIFDAPVTLRWTLAWE
ncbi:hypothetical protein ASA1KI_33060 [Opitutales bacterium ASA1]|uniref:hypothetical protein n=1 Tax=Congregicoccus parvus TaxID=3081749 RepID=UPI002B305EF8|nr:hypothetical protein ASA1KI_33060 [Opitutales bacterium ASA1]